MALKGIFSLVCLATAPVGAFFLFHIQHRTPTFETATWPYNHVPTTPKEECHTTTILSLFTKGQKEAYKKHIQTLSIDHPLRLGVTRKQRSTGLIHAAEVGNATRLELLLQAGADIDAVDLYRITSLHYAAAHGHLKAVQVLLRWGGSIGSGNVDSSPLCAAFANGHTEIFALMNSHLRDSNSTAALEVPTTHFNDTAVQLQYQFQRDAMALGPSYSKQSTTSVIPFDIDHMGAGSYYIDNAFCDCYIDKLVNLHDSLRKISNKQTENGTASSHRPQSTNAGRRSHYCDTEGWLCAALAAALKEHQQQQQASSLSTQHHVFSHFRFISYLGENATTSFLAPHRDFPVLDRSTGRMSTHTFILYLTTVDRGGETVLLDHLPSAKKIGGHQNNNNDSILLDNKIILYAVKPVKGRLFVFPHACPHAGQSVVTGSKLILRGDICVETS